MPDTAPNSWGGMAYLFPGTFLYVGPGGQADAHKHHAVQVILSAGEPFTLRLQNRALRTSAAVVPAGMEHTLDATGRQIALVLIEKQGPRGVAIDQLARNCQPGELRATLESLSLPAITSDAKQAEAWVAQLVVALGVEHHEVRGPSAAVRKILKFVETAVASRREELPRLTEAARRVGLSPTTLTHRFSREVGIPFRRYVLWARLKVAVSTAQAGASLTDAAHAAGFSDSAHLSRTFRRTFGLTPSAIVAVANIAGSLWETGGPENS